MNKYALSFYRQHSPFTDPGQFAHFFDDLPADPSNLVSIVQGLIIPPYSYILSLHNLSHSDIEIAGAGFGIRKIEKLIEKLLSISQTPLADARSPHLRLGVNCRNFATLLVSMLRHKSVPARERIGFAGYLGGAIYYEHRITEYWDELNTRWVLADSFLYPVQHKTLDIGFDTQDIKQTDPFLLAGEVWLKARQNKVDADHFGDSPDDIGLPSIRYALLHEFDALNGFEVLGNDAWGDLIEKPESDLTGDDLHFLDRVAALTVNPDATFNDLQALHCLSPYGRQVRVAAETHGMT